MHTDTRNNPNHGSAGGVKNTANQGGVERLPDGKWAPRSSGNPAGRPRLKSCLTDALRDELAYTLSTPVGEITRAEALARLVLVKALKGNRWAIKLVWDQIEGRPAQGILFEDLPPVLLVRTPLAIPAAAGEEVEHETK